MTEPIRPIPKPTVQPDGTVCAQSVCSPESFKARAGLKIRSNKVIPVVFLPGIMGSNLKTKVTRPGQKAEIAWRAPNGMMNGLDEADLWEERNPEARQRLLDPDNTEVDANGPFLYGNAKEKPLWLARGFGTVHLDSYGQMLYYLDRVLNSVFLPAWGAPAKNALSLYWHKVQRQEREEWGVTADEMPPLTDAELRKHAQYQYPVYAFGYNWLRTNAEAAELLHQKIEGWIAEWLKVGYSCEKVILVTHSMGGLVCRAYAKAHPERVLGVVHGVQPAVGAPLAYRRIACGTETSSPSNGLKGNITAGKFATIAGRTPAETQPVMAVSPGPLELLPCHLHPKEWLKVMLATVHTNVAKEVLSLPKADPYEEIYRNTDSWYRLIDPALVDPGKKYKDYTTDGKSKGPMVKVMEAINQAEHFHKSVVGDHYHSNTWAFYCHDNDYRSYGSVRWVGRWPGLSQPNAVELAAAPPASSNLPGRVRVEAGTAVPPPPYLSEISRAAMTGQMPPQRPPQRPVIEFSVSAQDAPGDGTVNWQSGAAPGECGIQRLFRTTGYDHQGAYNDTAMRRLTLHLICKIVQSAP